MSPMPQPGWYADPDGTPERLRWWDGTRWTENVHGGGQAPEAEHPRRGPWPWVALVTVAALVVAVGFGLGTGLLGRDSALGTPDPAPSVPAPLPTPSVKASRSSISASPRVSPAPTLPPVTAAPTAGPTRTPAPYPSIPAVPPAPADEGCPTSSGDATLGDGQLQLTLPSGWVPVDGLAWLGCARAATSAEETASLTLGIAPFPGDDLQEAAEYIWAIALLDAAIPHPMSQTSTPVTVSGLDGWMVSGTIGLGDQLDELTVIVVDAGGEAPSVVVTLTGTQDAASRAALEEALGSVRLA